MHASCGIQTQVLSIQVTKTRLCLWPRSHCDQLSLLMSPLTDFSYATCHSFTFHKNVSHPKTWERLGYFHWHVTNTPPPPETEQTWIHSSIWRTRLMLPCSDKNCFVYTDGGTKYQTPKTPSLRKRVWFSTDTCSLQSIRNEVRLTENVLQQQHMQGHQLHRSFKQKTSKQACPWTRELSAATVQPESCRRNILQGHLWSGKKPRNEVEKTLSSDDGGNYMYHLL
jgi:hypothetical protein